MTIYLSGQMRGLPNHGADVFAEYAKKWRDAGYHVINPAEMDARMPPYHTGTYKEYLTRDIELLLERADAIYMLPNWINSPGAVCERIVAETVGIPVFCAETGNALTEKLEVWYIKGREIKKVPQQGAHDE